MHVLSLCSDGNGVITSVANVPNVGSFLWKGKRYKRHHEPVSLMTLFEQVQEVFEGANRPRYTKGRHAFAGLVSCGTPRLPDW